MSTCHCDPNMTEVAQVAAVVDHDMDNGMNEDEHSMSDAENKDDDMTYEREDVNENNACEEKSEKLSHKEEDKACSVKDKAINKTEKTHTENVKQKENDKRERDESVAQDAEKKDAQPNTNEEQDMSDLSLKKEASEESNMLSHETNYIHRHHLPLLLKPFYMISPSTETPPIPKASGQKLRAKAEQREGRCDKQV